MKKNSIFLSLMLLGLFVFAACDSTEGELYQGENDKVSFLASKTNLNMKGDYLQVPIGRTSTDGELIVPVTLSATLYDKDGKNPYQNPGYSDAFKVVGDAKFEPGEGKAYVKVDYTGYGKVDPVSFAVTPNGFDVGVSLGFPFELKIQNDMLSPSNKGEAKITGLSDLEFADAGKGSIDSSEGWDGDVIDNVVYQKAKGVNAYKVIKPYSDYNIAFLIGADGVNVTFPKQAIDTHPSYGQVSMTSSKAVYDAVANTVTVTVSGYTVSAGTFGGGTEIFYLP